MPEPMVSHGRGGAANIRPDDTEYVDGSIVRQGPMGDQDNGAYSAGRGGRGNIASPKVKSKTDERGDREVVPDEAVRLGNVSEYHIGRGGEGNRRSSKTDANTLETPIKKETSLADKLKEKLIRRKSESAGSKPDTHT